MTTTSRYEASLCALYPSIASLEAGLRERVLAQQAQAVEVPAGTALFDEGAPCRGFPLVLAGEVRVARGSAGGRSIELYRVVPGELCVVSTACVFAQAAFTAHGTTTRASTLVVLSPEGFEAWCGDPGFRHFVFGVFAERLADLMSLAEAVAFQRLDQRLAAALLGHGAVVQTTHQGLADELGTVREIVTRLLRRFERAGWVRLARERIELLDVAGLRALSQGSEPAIGSQPAAALPPTSD